MAGHAVTARTGEGMGRMVRRIAPLVATGVIGLFAAAVVVAISVGAAQRGEVGYDADLYARIAQRWLDTGQLYYPTQLSGPYPPEGEVNLYPPLALYLFVPFTVLPRILWWAIPLATTVYAFCLHRPPTWTWPVFAAVAATAPFGTMLAYGNTGMWVLAIVSLATLRPALAILLAFKPPVFPIALLFAGRRSWWLGAALVTVAAIPFWAYWPQFVTAARNVGGPTLLYSINSALMFAMPIFAWLTGRRCRSAASSVQSARSR